MLAACGGTTPVKEASTPVEHPTKIEWAGPTNLPDGVTVLLSAQAWEGFRAGLPSTARTGFAVDWSKEVVLVIAGREDSELGKRVRVSRLARPADQVELDLVFEGPGADVSMPNHPTAFATAPAAPFAGQPAVRLTWQGQPWDAPVKYLP